MGCAVKLVTSCDSLILLLFALVWPQICSLKFRSDILTATIRFASREGNLSWKPAGRKGTKGTSQFLSFIMIWWTRCLQKFIPLLRGETRILPLAWHIKVTSIWVVLFFWMSANKMELVVQCHLKWGFGSFYFDLKRGYIRMGELKAWKKLWSYVLNKTWKCYFINLLIKLKKWKGTRATIGPVCMHVYTCEVIKETQNRVQNMPQKECGSNCKCSWGNREVKIC